MNFGGDKVRKLIAVIFLLLLPSLVFAGSLGFRDFKMGMAKKEVMSNPSLYCSEDYCQKSDEIYNIPVDVYFYFNSSYLESDKINCIGITFDSISYDDMKENLVEKYGRKYKCTQSAVQNRMGAKFMDEYCEWKLKEGEINISKYNSKLNEGVIWLFDNEYLKAVQTGKKIKKGAGF